MSTFESSDFEVQMQSILEEKDWNLLVQALQSPSPVSIRHNPFKGGIDITGLEAVPWSKGGYYLPERPSFTLDPTFHAGAYYVQEASSMFVGQAVQQLFSSQEAIRALDLCAAPGGKSTDLLSNLPNGSLLVANEVIRSRYNILQQNIIKWGQSNVVCTNHDSRDFSQLNSFFDLILVDAPCSGEGLFRKDHKARDEWSINNVQLCTGRQKRILADAVELLAPGGYLLYSTCTYNRSENEDNAQWLEAEFGLKPINLKLDEEWNIEAREIGYQFYPHRLKGEGFYLAVLQKQEGARYHYPKRLTPLKSVSKSIQQELEGWVKQAEQQYFIKDEKQNAISMIPQTLEQNIMAISHALKRFRIGTELGHLKRKDFIPSHELALSNMLGDTPPRVSLSLPEALKYLKKETFQAENMPQGWMLACYKGFPLGWAKGLKQRVNNYFPKGWRIRMAV